MKTVEIGDLRLGNIIEVNVMNTYKGVKDWTVVKVCGLMDGSVFKNSEPNKVYFVEPQIGTFRLLKQCSKLGDENLRGILITKSMLLKLKAIEMEIRDFYSFNLNGTQINFINGAWKDYATGVEINGLHHLQNIIFFRTGVKLDLSDLL